MTDRTFIAIGDIHACHSLTQWRRNCLPDILAKLDYVVEQVGIKDTLIIAGDIFDSAEAAHGTVSAVHGVLSKEREFTASSTYTSPILGVTGQHDLPKHGNWKRGPAHSLSWYYGFHLRGTPGVHLHISETDDFTVAYAPFGTTDYDSGLLLSADLIIMHDMLVSSSVPWDHILLDDFAKLFDDRKERVIVCGDNHTGYPPTKIGTTWFVNPGAMTRTKRSDRERIPQYARIEFGENGVHIKYHEIPHRPAEEVFDMTGYGDERIVVSDEMSEFVQNIQQQHTDLSEIDFTTLEAGEPEVVDVVRDATEKAKKELGYE